jgi:hypothetical protein
MKQLQAMGGLNSESDELGFREGFRPAIGEDSLEERCKVHHVTGLQLLHHARVVHHVHISVTQGTYPRYIAQEDVIDLRGRVVSSQRIGARVNEQQHDTVALGPWYSKKLDQPERCIY